jgi:hypothetical protein
MPNAFTLATSLVPGRNLDVQKAAVASWAKLGFRILSFNRGSEIAPLGQDFPDVAFHDPGRDAGEVTGKPLVFLSDILAYFIDRQPGVFGIINSDIVLDAPHDLKAQLQAEARDALVVATRVEIDDLASREGKRNLWGFDAMFLDTNMARRFTDCGFCLGMPFWDYWMPMTAALHGLAYKQIKTDIAFHLRHAEAWSDKRFLFSHMFVKFLQDEIVRAMSGKPEDPAFIFLQGYFTYYYNKIHARLLGGDTADLAEDEKFHIAAQFAEFTDALNETTFMFMRRQARLIELSQTP